MHWKCPIEDCSNCTGYLCDKADENDDDLLDEEIDNKPYWFCEMCGYKNEKKPMPLDRQKFYDKVASSHAPICPKCKSESLMPVGF